MVKENPDLPAGDGKNNPDEPPQIKGPVELPQREVEKVVQVDRPDAGKIPPPPQANPELSPDFEQRGINCLSIQASHCRREKPIATNRPSPTTASWWTREKTKPS